MVIYEIKNLQEASKLIGRKFMKNLNSQSCGGGSKGVIIGISQSIMPWGYPNKKDNGEAWARDHDIFLTISFEHSPQMTCGVSLNQFGYDENSEYIILNQELKFSEED